MRRIAFLAAILLSGLCHAQQPNVVLVILDDMSYEQFAMHGHPDSETPNFDRLASGGVTFPRSVCQCLCRPSLATLLTGRRPEEHGTHGNFGGATLPAVDTLPQTLDAAGYRTRCDGKFWEGTPANFGFDESGTFTDSWGDADFIRDGQVDTIRFVRDAVAASEPFFLWWAPQMPHTPHDPPQRYVDLFPLPTVPTWFTGDQNQYRGYQDDYLSMAYWADEGLGHLMGELSLLGVLDDTLIVAISDNGWAVGAASKLAPFEMGTISPLVFHWPNGLTAQTLTGIPDESDVAPTILSLCGVTAPGSMSGMDLSPFGTVTLPDYQFGHSWQQSQTTNWDDQDVSVFCRSQDGWKYIRWEKSVSPTQDYGMQEVPLAVAPTRLVGDEDLFYLGDDPYEQSDLSANPSHAAKLAELRDATNAWLVTLNAGPPPPTGTIIDNDEDADPAFTTTGNWVYTPTPNHGGAYLIDSHYAAAGSGSIHADWTFTGLDPAKTYQVSATWNPFSNRATDAPYTLMDDATPLLTADLNQEVPADDFIDSGQLWEIIGTIQPSSGTIVVRLTNDANEYVMADAIHVQEVP